MQLNAVQVGVVNAGLLLRSLAPATKGDGQDAVSAGQLLGGLAITGSSICEFPVRPEQVLHALACKLSSFKISKSLPVTEKTIAL